VGVDYQKLVDTIVTRRNGLVTLPATISSQEAVSLPTIVLPSWIALVEIGRINADSVVLIHDALSR
jgi:NADPH:quinone reductase-like Zn-dependent oxidoreductase